MAEKKKETTEKDGTRLREDASARQAEGTQVTEGTEAEQKARESLLPPAAKKEEAPAIAVDYPVVECPFCLSRDTRVAQNSKRDLKKLAVGPGWRRRTCASCKRDFKEAVTADEKTASAKA